MITVKEVTVKKYILELTKEQAESLSAILGSGINANVLSDLGLYDLQTELTEFLGEFTLQNKGPNLCRWRGDIPVETVQISSNA